MQKLMGGIFLVVGTCIGAGILALPVSIAPGGFLPAALLMLGCWALMTFNAFLILEVNLWLPENSNMISMAKSTLGIFGQMIAWLSYSLLLYALLAAYISAGSDILGNLLGMTGFHTSSALCSLIFVGLFGLIVYRGIKMIDYVNRGLILIKMGGLTILIALIAQYIQPSLLEDWHPTQLLSGLMVVITSFGSAIIVPSLRVYFNSDIQKLRAVILYGSLIALVFYLFWILAILGSLPLEGSNGLLTILHSGETTSQLIRSLTQVTQDLNITQLIRLFSSLSVATSFLGVSLSLSDFLADGLHVKKKGRGNWIVYSGTYLPPLLIVLFYPGVFIIALSYAGIFCTILLALLPSLMIWSGRYWQNTQGPYQVFGGKWLILISLVAACLVTVTGMYVA